MLGIRSLIVVSTLCLLALGGLAAVLVASDRPEATTSEAASVDHTPSTALPGSDPAKRRERAIAGGANEPGERRASASAFSTPAVEAVPGARAPTGPSALVYRSSGAADAASATPQRYAPDRVRPPTWGHASNPRNTHLPPEEGGPQSNIEANRARRAIEAQFAPEEEIVVYSDDPMVDLLIRRRLGSEPHLAEDPALFAQLSELAVTTADKLGPQAELYMLRVGSAPPTALTPLRRFMRAPIYVQAEK